MGAQRKWLLNSTSILQEGLLMHDFTVQIETGSFTVGVSPTTNYGYFEHHDLGDEYGGGLWFNGNELIDYDGVFELPLEVIEGLEEHGYDMNYAKDQDVTP